MSKFLDNDGTTEIEIPTLEFYPVEDSQFGEMLKVSNKEDLEKLVMAMGWNNLFAFEEATGVAAAELIGKWWLTMHDRVWIADGRSVYNELNGR